MSAGFPGEIFGFVRDCWRLPDAAKRLEQDRLNIDQGTGDPDQFRSLTSTYRKGIGEVSKLLTSHFKIKLITFRKRKYRLSSIPDFCLIKHL